MGLFKSEGRNLAFDVKLNPPIKYPAQEERWPVYGKPLSHIVHRFFDDSAIMWGKDEKGRLHELIIVCYGANFKYKKSEEFGFMGSIYRAVSSEVQTFFQQFKTTAKIVNLARLVPQTMQDFLALEAKEKIEKSPEKRKAILKEIFVEIDYPQREYEFFVLRSKNKGVALKQAKEVCESLKQRGKKNVRLNPKHPNIVEVKTKQGKWITLLVYIDATTTYLPKGTKDIIPLEYKDMVARLQPSKR
jgi:hypothetical protein